MGSRLYICLFASLHGRYRSRIRNLRGEKQSGEVPDADDAGFSAHLDALDGEAGGPLDGGLVVEDVPDGRFRLLVGDGEDVDLTVPDEETEAAVGDVLDDEATVERAARFGVERVEVRAEPGVVSVRYLP